MRRPLFLSALIVSLAACRSTEQGPTTHRVVLVKPKKPEGDPLKPPEWFEAQIELAAREREQGRLRAALERVYAARAQAPGAAHTRRLDLLLQRLNRDVLELETITAWVEIEKDPILFGQPLHLRIHVKNGSKRRVVVPARVEGASNSLFVLFVLRRSYDVRAQIASRRTRIVKPLQRAFDLAPGASADQVLIIEGARVENDRPLDGFRTYEIGGSLRPAVLEVGGMQRWEAIPIRPGVLRSFRPNYQHLADDPVARVGQAIGKRSGVHLLTAAALVPWSGRQAAVDKMVAELHGDRRIDWAIYGALEYLTEAGLGPDAAAWRAWWPRVRERFFAKPPRRSSDLPTFEADG